ncbi:helix-turn-helix transcriptional regulator [Mesorhizobium sp. WSM4303]|nr:helix-turn-helix transcriptional regulator [Mesorhizobium sp. WSM4306]TRC96659.1 helix-turn-helix transcriptional regulator [Mesorhizobium sp. WSM4303]
MDCLASQSRATFARRFTRLVGEPPLAYVARWRMNLAAKALRETNRTIDEIGRAVGYESAPSLSQAFTRLIAIAEVCSRLAQRPEYLTPPISAGRAGRSR